MGLLKNLAKSVVPDFDMPYMAEQYEPLPEEDDGEAEENVETETHGKSAPVESPDKAKEAEARDHAMGNVQIN